MCFLPCSVVLNLIRQVVRDVGPPKASDQPRTEGAGAGSGEQELFPSRQATLPLCPPPLLRGKAFQSPSLEPRPPPGRGLGGPVHGTHRRSRPGAAAATCRTSPRRRAEQACGKQRRNRRNAGRREGSGEARGVAGAQAHSRGRAPGSARRGCRLDAAGSRRSPGRGLQVRTPPSLRASSSGSPLPPCALSPSGATQIAAPLQPGASPEVGGPGGTR